MSLFDFDQFDPDRYFEHHPISNWDYFVPYRTDWGSAIWIEIDRAQVAPCLITPTDLLAKQKSENGRRHKLMPHIEGAHVGPLPLLAFKRVLLVQKGRLQIRRLRPPDFSLTPVQRRHRVNR
ncbi:MAG: hypothetical protein HIU82_12515 [Proteobacteria bacterium]|nr:hypothetical protein [Pseudomonadota bacterium]